MITKILIRLPEQLCKLLWTVLILHQLAVALRSPPAAPLTDRSKQKPDCFAVEFKYLHNLNISKLNPRQLLARCSRFELKCTRRRRAKLKSDLSSRNCEPESEMKVDRKWLEQLHKVSRGQSSDFRRRSTMHFSIPETQEFTSGSSVFTVSLHQISRCFLCIINSARTHIRSERNLAKQPSYYFNETRFLLNQVWD